MTARCATLATPRTKLREATPVDAIWASRKCRRCVPAGRSKTRFHQNTISPTERSITIMAKKRKKKSDWAEAKTRCRLSMVEVQMAKELGMKPKSLIKNIPNSNQLWKSPVKEWVRDLYRKKFGDRKPKMPDRKD